MAFWDPDVELELDEGERIIFMSRRHWVLLVRNGSIPFVIALVFGGIAVFRAIGGTFLAADPALAGQFDWVNYLLLAGVGVLLFLYARGADLAAKAGRGRQPFGRLNLTWLLAIGIGLLAVVIWYRYQGGRLLGIDPANARPFDLLNIVLIVIASVATLSFLYILIDWRDDTLVLTNTRVVYDNEEFLIRHVQQQILLADVQQVFMRQNTYPSAIFGYGSLTVQSFSLRRINFDFATRPQEMERLIKQELNRVRKQIEPNLLRRLIEEQVFESRPKTQPAPQRMYVHTHGLGRSEWVRWIFPPNPEIDQRTGTVTWRPSSTYVGIQLMRPVGLFIITSAVAIALVVQSADLLAWAFAAWLLVTLVCAFWVFWIREELVNDVYILSRRDIVDVDKRPFGPVTRRTAPIGNIQNVSFDISFIESLLGFGTVKIQTGGTGEFTFNHVPDPRGVQATINDYLTDFKKSADERNLQNSLDIFKEYHALQREQGELVDRAAIERAIDERAGERVSEYAAATVRREVALQVRAELRRLRRSALRRRVRRIMRERSQENGTTP